MNHETCSDDGFAQLDERWNKIIPEYSLCVEQHILEDIVQIRFTTVQ